MGMKGDMSEETEHLLFEFRENTGKTWKIDVYNRHSHSFIGEVRWFGRWRKYCFFPDDETVYDSKCMTDISWFLEMMMKDYKENEPERLCVICGDRDCIKYHIKEDKK